MAQPTPTAQAPPEWRNHEVQDRDERVRFHGRLIASATSERPTKLRWFEVDLYEVTDDREYVERDGEAYDIIVHTRGMSRMKGEVTLYRVVGPTSAVRAVQSLVVHHDGETYLPEVSQRALRDATQLHDGLRIAYAQVPRNLLP